MPRFFAPHSSYVVWNPTGSPGFPSICTPIDLHAQHGGIGFVNKKTFWVPNDLRVTGLAAKVKANPSGYTSTRLNLGYFRNSTGHSVDVPLVTVAPSTEFTMTTCDATFPTSINGNSWCSAAQDNSNDGAEFPGMCGIFYEMQDSNATLASNRATSCRVMTHYSYPNEGNGNWLIGEHGGQPNAYSTQLTMTGGLNNSIPSPEILFGPYAVPVAGTIKGLWVAWTSNIATGSLTYTVYKEGIAQPLSLTFSVASDSINRIFMVRGIDVSVAAHDLIDVRTNDIVQNQTAMIGLLFEAA